MPMTNEPTTGENNDWISTEIIVRMLRKIQNSAQVVLDSGFGTRDGECNMVYRDRRDNMKLAADRLESQEQKLELLNGGDFDVIDIPAALAYLESVEEILPHASALIDLIQSLKGTAIELTARAEQAELERDAAVVDMKSIVDAVREEYIDGTCCFACKYDFDTSCDEYGCCPVECPGFESNDCFEWRGLPQEGEKQNG